MSNEEEKIPKFKIKPQSACKRFKGKKLGKDEYWSPNLFKGRKPYEYGKKIETMDIDLCDKELSNWKEGMSKKIETMDMETGFIEEEFQDDEEEIQDDEPLTLINAQSKGHFS
jgi:hypothetical protein